MLPSLPDSDSEVFETASKNDVENLVDTTQRDLEPEPEPSPEPRSEPEPRACHSKHAVSADISQENVLKGKQTRCLNLERCWVFHSHHDSRKIELLCVFVTAAQSVCKHQSTLPPLPRFLKDVYKHLKKNAFLEAMNVEFETIAACKTWKKVK